MLALAASGCGTARLAAPPPQDETDPAATAAFEEYFQSIREGAAAPGIIRGSGGCGCN